MELDVTDVAKALGMAQLENIRLQKRIEQLERELVARQTGEYVYEPTPVNGVSETANVA